jgi:hypothetical protein
MVRITPLGLAHLEQRRLIQRRLAQRANRDERSG